MMNIEGDDEWTLRPRPQNRDSAESKLRRNKKYCPVCLAELKKNTGRTRRRRSCVSCRATPMNDKRCVRCRAENVWEGPKGAACRTCGHHGRKEDVVEVVRS